MRFPLLIHFEREAVKYKNDEQFKFIDFNFKHVLTKIKPIIDWEDFEDYGKYLVGIYHK